MLSVTIALTPIILASVIQGMDRARRDTADVRERLLETARAAGTSEENMLAAAEQIARALANLAAVRQAGPDCNRALSDTLKGLSFFTDIARIDGTGKVICAANPLAIGRTVSARRVWQEAMAGHDFVLSERLVSPLTNRPVITGMLPLLDDGKAFGAIAIGIDVRWLDYMINSAKLPQGSVVAIYDQAGVLIASNNAQIAGTLFAHMPRAHSNSEEIHSARDSKRQAWIYATAPLLKKSVSVAFAMRQSSLFGATYVHVGTDFILPILMIALTWIAIWIGTERQVTRWLVYLQRFSAAYRSGHYTIRPSLAGAPAEFRQLGDALSVMAQSIQERDRSLREAVEQKTLLIHEIHHRVKNNLQIVMSLLNLQAGRLTDPAAQAALKQSQARINALALIHRTLHDIEDQSFIHLDRLLADLAKQTCDGFSGKRNGFPLELNMVPRLVSSDIAVPLALFTVEALTNVFKHAYPHTQDGFIRVSLQEADGHELGLRVEDKGEGMAADGHENSIGAQLISSFAKQVNGEVLTRSEPGKGTIVELRFPDPQFS